MTVIVVTTMAIMMLMRRFIFLNTVIVTIDRDDRIEYRRRFLSDYCHRDDDRVEYRRQWVWLKVFQADQILLW